MTHVFEIFASFDGGLINGYVLLLIILIGFDPEKGSENKRMLHSSELVKSRSGYRDTRDLLGRRSDAPGRRSDAPGRHELKENLWERGPYIGPFINLAANFNKKSSLMRKLINQTTRPTEYSPLIGLKP